MENKRGVGTHYEDIAVKFLEENKYTILERNFRFHRDEIDIIAKDDDTIVFVEVKYRSSEIKGYPSEAVDYKTDVPCRFDVVGILGDKIEHIKNAFDFIGN